MKRVVSLITALALALHASGLTLAAEFGRSNDSADRMIEMVDGTGTTTWDYWDDGQVKEMASPQGTILYDYYATTGRLQYLSEVISGGTNIVTGYASYLSLTTR